MDYRKEGEKLWARFNGGKQGALWYYRALVNAFKGKSRKLSGLMQELDRTLTVLELLSNDGAQVKQPPAPNEAAK
jgi:GTP pyrophosphokinase